MVYAFAVALVFAYTLVDNVIERPDGIIIASVFIAFFIAVSTLSRYVRATELRVSGVKFTSPESEKLFLEIKGKKVHLAPTRRGDPVFRARKLAEINEHYQVKGPVAFIRVTLLDNRSDFLAPILIDVRREDDTYYIEVNQAVAIANTIAYISEQLDPIGIFLELSRKNLIAQSLRFLLLGEGETGLMVYTILLRYWELTPEDDVRPCIYLMST